MIEERREIWGWGRWPRRQCRIVTPRAPADVVKVVGAQAGGLIARGLGRGYGDCALSPAGTVSTVQIDRMIAFDDETGVVIVEAGVSLADLIETFLPCGYFPKVTPGTKFVTVGGAIAADVHGKNHHIDGAFGDHVLWFDLIGEDGRETRCSADQHADLFNATFGAMGLTGVITRAALRLHPVESGWIRQKTFVAADLDAALGIFEGNMDATYSVAWIDCLAKGTSRGRSLVHLGEHAAISDLPSGCVAEPYKVPVRKPKRVPFDAPSWALNRFSVRAFNQLYYSAGKQGQSEKLVDWDSYFYPLDKLLEWNRIYGAPGFAQYQNALPLSTARDALADTLDAISDAGLGSFLAVLKRFGGGAPERPLSFPIEGYTLALDFSLTSSALSLMDRLDEITLAAGGRVYLAKDSRMTQQTFERGYHAGRADFVRLVDAMHKAAGTTNSRFASLQSARLGL